MTYINHKVDIINNFNDVAYCYIDIDVAFNSITEFAYEFFYFGINTGKWVKNVEFNNIGFLPLKIMFSFSPTSALEWQPNYEFPIKNVGLIPITKIYGYDSLTIDHNIFNKDNVKIYYKIKGLDDTGSDDYLSHDSRYSYVQFIPYNKDYISTEQYNGIAEGQEKHRFWGRAFNNRLKNQVSFFEEQTFLLKHLLTMKPFCLSEIIYFRAFLNSIEYILYQNQTTWFDTGTKQLLDELEFRFYKFSDSIGNIPTYNDHITTDGFDITLNGNTKVNPTTNGKHRISGEWKNDQQYFSAVSNIWKQEGNNIVYNYTQSTVFKQFALYPDRKILTSTVEHLLPKSLPYNPKFIFDTNKFALPVGSIPGMYRNIYPNELFAVLFRLLETFNNAIDENGIFHYPEIKNIDDRMLGYNNVEDTQTTFWTGGSNYRTVNIDLKYTITEETVEDDTGIRNNTISYTGYSTETFGNDAFDPNDTRSAQFLLNAPVAVGCYDNSNPPYDENYFMHTYEGCWLIEKNDTTTMKSFIDKIGTEIPNLLNALNIKNSKYVTTNVGPSIFQYKSGNLKGSAIGIELYLINRYDINNKKDYDCNKYPKINDITSASYNPDTTTNYNFVWNELVSNNTNNLRSEDGINGTYKLENIPRSLWTLYLRYFMNELLQDTYKKIPVFYANKGGNWGIYYPFTTTHNSVSEQTFPLEHSVVTNTDDCNTFKMKFPSFPQQGCINTENKCCLPEEYHYFRINGDGSEFYPGFAPCGYYRDEPEKYGNAWSAGVRFELNKSWEVTLNGITFHEALILNKNAILNNVLPLTTHYPEHTSKYNEMGNGKYEL